MRVFVASAPALVSPLEAPAGDAIVLDRTLRETMAATFHAVGLEVVPVPSLKNAEECARAEHAGAFVVSESLLASPLVVRRFAAVARKASGDVSLKCALPRGLATDLLSHLDGLQASEQPSGGSLWTAPLYFLRGHASSLEASKPTLLPYKEQTLRFAIPPGVDGRSEHQVGISESYMCDVSNWAHVLRVNTAAVAGWWFQRLRWGFALGPLWFAWRVLCGFPWVAGRFGGALNSISARARVHHTAHAELSVIQRGASIGAHASIRNSFIGEGAQIGEGARIFGSVIGKGAFVGTNAVVFGCVVYPEAFAAQVLMQASLLARRACAFTNSGFFDVNFSRNIRVAHKGGFADSGVTFLGACVGPEARIAAGVWVGSGREVPAGALVIKPPELLLTRVGTPEKGVAYMVRDGTLVRADKRNA